MTRERPRNINSGRCCSQSTNWKGCAISVDHYTCRVTWSAEDGEHVGLCAEFPSLFWLAKSPEAALEGIRHGVAEAVADMQAAGEEIPVPRAGKHCSGECRVRVPPQVHCALATQASKQGVSLNRLTSAMLAA